MSEADRADVAGSSRPRVDRIAERSGGALEHVRYLVRCFLLFGHNRVVGQLPGHALRLAYLRHVLGWSIGERSSVHHGLKIFGGRGRVRIGNSSTVQMDCLLVGAGMTDLTIGDRVGIGYRVSLILGGHDIFSPTFPGVSGALTIEDYVFVGSGATILYGLTLGEGTVVAAGSVVTKSTPPYSIVRGNPARVVGRRPRGLNYTAEHFWAFH